MKKHIIITRGLPGSGKTTWAREQQKKEPGKYKVICKDDLRAMFDGGVWSKANEKFVIAMRNMLILNTLQAGFIPIVADTNLDPKHEQSIRELVGEGTRHQFATVEVKDFTTVPLEECIKRDQRRPNYVGEKVIRKMWHQYLAPKTSSYRPEDTSKLWAVICDLDGTAALLNGRDPYNAATCEQDLPHWPVLSVLHRFMADHTILFTSGRSEEHREQTERWIQQYLSTCRYHLFMRPIGDSRQDAIIKREIFEQHIADHYNIRFVLDDRDSVVWLWRSLGLPCFQVADGNF